MGVCVWIDDMEQKVRLRELDEVSRLVLVGDYDGVDVEKVGRLVCGMEGELKAGDGFVAVMDGFEVKKMELERLGGCGVAADSVYVEYVKSRVEVAVSLGDYFVDCLKVCGGLDVEVWNGDRGVWITRQGVGERLMEMACSCYRGGSGMKVIGDEVRRICRQWVESKRGSVIDGYVEACDRFRVDAYGCIMRNYV